MTTADGGPAVSADGRGSMNHVAIGILGLLTIVAYGTWYYAFGVLLDPIRIDTGWNESALATSFSIGVVTVGIGSVFGGRILDKLGSRTVLILGGLGGGLSLLITSYSTSILVFVVSSAVGLGFLGSFGFYHTTMTTAVRVNPSNPSRAIAVLTIWGAFASVVYLPLAAALVNRFEWRVSVRIMAVVAMVMFAIAAVVIPAAQRRAEGSVESDPERDDAPPPSLRQVLASTLTTPERRWFTAAVALGGIAMSTLLVYQVPAMTAAGLPLATAATVAGIRGFCQTGGRIPLTPLINWLGASGAMVLAFGSIAVGGVLLAFSGNLAVALVFAVFTGFGIGAFSPLQGIKAEELFERETLGATMGTYSGVLMVAGSTGPAMAGVLADATGDRRVVSIIIVVAAVGATLSAARLGSRAAAPV